MTETVFIPYNSSSVKDEDLYSRFIDDKYISAKVLHRPLAMYFAYSNDNILGDCISASLRCYMKLKKAGAIRVGGTRKYDREYPFDDGNIGRHYWVENKGFVFDESLGLQRIYKKEDYYRDFEIEDIEVSTEGFLLTDFDGEEEALLYANRLTDTNKHQFIVYMEKIHEVEDVIKLREM
jgi:hypothetical protein